MKMKTKTMCKVLSVFLTFLIVVQILPLQVLAESVTDAIAHKEFIEDVLNNPTSEDNTSDAEILYEVEEKRDEYTKVYKKSDGTYTAIMTEEPLHYLNDGVWEEINNSMSLNKNLYTNLDNLFNVELPETIDSNENLTVEKDGYELSFSVNNIEESSAVVENDIVVSDTNISVADEAIAQTQSSVTYNDVAEDTDLQYIVTPNSIKENIIVSNKESVKDTYTFTFEPNGLDAEKLDDGSVIFKDENNEIKFRIPRPVMTDANFAFSYDIDVVLIENADGTISLEYSPSCDWTSSSDRVYPITIDPAIVVENKEVSWVEDTYVMYDSSRNEMQNTNFCNDYVGGAIDFTHTDNDGNEQYVNAEIYTKFNVDAIKSLGENIVFTEVQYLFIGASADGKALAKKIATPIDLTTVTYATKPSLEDEVIDYHTSIYSLEDDNIDFSYIHFNITKPLNEWFNGAKNNGFAVIPGNEGYYGLYYLNGVQPTTSSSGTTTKTYTTVIVMDYVEVGGYNENHNYHSQSVGRAGTGYVNDFTQTVSVLRDDLSIDGNIMPVTVGMIYNSATYDKMKSLNYDTMMAYGNGWAPNYLRGFVRMSDNQLTYYTETGAAIDYTCTIENDAVTFEETYSDIHGEHGYEIEYIAATDTEAEHIVITRPDGYEERFNNMGLLASVTNPDYPSQKINIVYDSMFRIDYITDGVGRKYDYIYDDTTNLLSKVKCYAANGTPITAGSTTFPLEVNYTYDENKNLIEVTFADGKSAEYTYNDNGDLTIMKNIDDYRVEYKYTDDDPDNDETEIVTSRVKKVIEWTRDNEENIDVEGNNISYDTSNYPHITLTDGNGNYETYQFDVSGKLLYTIDNMDNCSMTGYSTNDTYFVSSSGEHTISQNLLLNPSFESQGLTSNIAENWTSTNSAFVRASSDDTHFGGYNFYSSNSGTASVKQDVTVLGNGQYTFSAYVKSDDANEGSLYIKISAYNRSNTLLASELSPNIESTAGEWLRYSVTLDIPESTAANKIAKKLTVEFGSTDSGLFSVDDVQLEQSPSTSSFNYIKNGGFRYGTDDWENASDKTIVNTTINNELAKALTFTGGLNASNSICQTITINGKKGDAFTVGGWLKGSFVNSSTNNKWILNTIEESTTDIFNFTNDRFAQIEVRYEYEQDNEDGTNEFITEKVVIPFAENIDDWQFAAKSFALAADCEKITISVHYNNNIETAYISNFEVTKDMEAIVLSKDKEISTEDETTCVCEDCEEIDCTCRCNPENICECIPCKRRSYETTTDSFGNITSNSSFDGFKTIEHLSSYTLDGNYLATETDSDGNTVEYAHNQLNGILTFVTDGNHNTTSYTYDAYGLLTAVSAINTDYLSGNTVTASANYTYEKDKLVSITHNGFSYNFSYDYWGQLKEVSVNEQPIVTYTYGEYECRDRIIEVTYHNNDSQNPEITSSSILVEYYYDMAGNITDILINSVKNYKYKYDSFGNLTSVNEIGVRITNYIDGRIEVIDNNRNIYTSFTNKEGEFVEILGGVAYTNENGELTNIENGAIYTSQSFDSVYDVASGKTTEKSDITTPNNKTIGSISQKDWFGRYTESIIQTESVSDDNLDNEFVAIKTQYTYPEYDNQKTSNQIISYSNMITYGTDTSINNKEAYYGFSYTYDDNGNIIEEYKQSITGAKVLRYAYVYDSLNQLVRVNDSINDVTYVYSYDNAGNILSKAEYFYTTDAIITDEPEKIVNYTYDVNWKDRLNSYNGEEIIYDNIGNPITFDGASLSWIGRQLESYTFTEEDENENLITKRIIYSYDENGLRNRKSVYIKLPDEDDNSYILSEQYDYTWSNGLLINQVYTEYKNNISTVFAVKFIYDAFSSPQGFTLNNKTYLYLKNIQGDIIGVIDELGNNVLTYTYNSWGQFKQTVEADDNRNTIKYMKRFLPFAYRGYCYDYDTGLYYLQSRYYSPKIGRFINTDDTQMAIVTLGETLGVNLFAYCNNNPIVYADYNGYVSVTFYNYRIYWDNPNDDAFFYNRNIKPTEDDYKNWKTWGNLQKAASLLYPQGAAFYKHYRSNKGTDYYYDYGLAYKQDSSIKSNVNSVLNLLKTATEYFKKNNNTWYTVCSSLVYVSSKTMNWRLALGGHRFYVYASAYYNSSTKKYTVNYTVLAQDRYNFDGNGKSFLGIPDTLNARFVTLGWAKFFNSIGTMTGTLTWKKK